MTVDLTTLRGYPYSTLVVTPAGRHNAATTPGQKNKTDCRNTRFSPHHPPASPHHTRAPALPRGHKYRNAVFTHSALPHTAGVRSKRPSFSSKNCVGPWDASIHTGYFCVGPKTRASTHSCVGPRTRACTPTSPTMTAHAHTGTLKP